MIGNGSSSNGTSYVKWGWINAILLVAVVAFTGYWVHANDKRIDELYVSKTEREVWASEFSIKILSDLAVIKSQLADIQRRLNESREDEIYRRKKELDR